MSLTKIKRRISLDAKFFDQNIYSHLLTKLSHDTAEECTNEHGYIIHVHNILEIITSEDTIFTVIFEAETFKPERGKKVKGNVCMIYRDGIFITIKDKQKMLIPTSVLIGYEYDEDSHCFINEERRIENGDMINAIVTASKYNNKKFSCFGSLA